MIMKQLKSTELSYLESVIQEKVPELRRLNAPIRAGDDQLEVFDEN